jgi:hypothetical protein
LNNGRWCSAKEIAAKANIPPEIVVIDYFEIDYRLKLLDEYKLNKNAYILHMNGYRGILSSGGIRRNNTEWPSVEADNELLNKDIKYFYFHYFYMRTLLSTLVEALAKSWDVSTDSIMKSILKENQFTNLNMVSAGTTRGKELKLEGLRIVKPAQHKRHKTTKK